MRAQHLRCSQGALRLLEMPQLRQPPVEPIQKPAGLCTAPARKGRGKEEQARNRDEMEGCRERKMGWRAARLRMCPHCPEPYSGISFIVLNLPGMLMDTVLS